MERVGREPSESIARDLRRYQKDMRSTLFKKSFGYVCAAKATQYDNERLPLILTKDQKSRDLNDIVTSREHDGKFRAIAVIKPCVFRLSRVL